MGDAEVEALGVAVQHFKSLDWLHSREGTKVHLTGGVPASEGHGGGHSESYQSPQGH